MLAINMKGWPAWSAGAMLLCGCATPCDGGQIGPDPAWSGRLQPARLCAPMASITSVPPVRAYRLASLAVADPATADETALGTAADAPRPADASGGGAPAAGGGGPLRIGLLLPLRSETLGQAAAFVRDGFMAAYQRESDGVVVSVIDSGDGGPDALASYAREQEQQDVMVGPLTRAAVSALAGSALVRKPTIALNHPEAAHALPPAMLVIGLSLEDEARQVAAWAATEHADTDDALILHAGAPWQRRSAAAFASQWRDMGLAADTLELSALDSGLSEAELAQLRAHLRAAPAALLFAALDARQARQLRTALGRDVPLYGTSSLNPGAGYAEPDPALDGVRLLDLPWQVQPDHPAVMIYPQPIGTEQRQLTADMERLYALGIDAFRVAREVGLRPGAPFRIDGVTGRLTVSFGKDAARFERIEQTAVYRDGVLEALATPAAR